MAYLDYNLPNTIDLTPGMSAMGDALTEVLRAKQERLKQERLLAQRKMEVDYQNRAQERLEKRDKAQFQMQDEARRAGAEKEIRERLAKGDTEGARMVAGGTSVFDPDTHDRTGTMGIRMGEPNLPPKPQTTVAPAALQGLPPEIAARRRGMQSRVEPAPGAMIGPIPTTEEAFVGARPGASEMEMQETEEERMRQEAMRADFERRAQADRQQRTSDMIAEEQHGADAEAHALAMQGYDQRQKAFPGEMQTYGREASEARRAAPAYLTSPGQPDREIDVKALRTQARQTAADEFVASVGPQVRTEQDQRAFQNAHAGILAGGLDPKAAVVQFNKERLGIQEQEFRHGEGLLRDEAALERAKVPKPGLNIQLEGLREKQAAGTRADLSELRKDFSDWEAKVATLPLDSKSSKRLATAYANLSSNNAMMQREGAEGLVGFFRGGVVTGQAQKYLLDHLSGIVGDAQTWLQKRKTGGYGPRDLAVLREAAKSAYEEQQTKAAQHYRSAVGRFGPGAGYDAYGGNLNAKVLGTLREFGYEAAPLYPDAEPIQLGSSGRPYKRRGPPEAAARGKGKSKALDEAMSD